MLCLGGNYFVSVLLPSNYFSHLQSNCLPLLDCDLLQGAGDLSLDSHVFTSDVKKSPWTCIYRHQQSPSVFTSVDRSRGKGVCNYSQSWLRDQRAARLVRPGLGSISDEWWGHYYECYAGMWVKSHGRNAFLLLSCLHCNDRHTYTYIYA